MPSSVHFWAFDPSDDQVNWKSKQWASLAEEVANIGYWQLDVATKVIRWSDGLFQLYGLPVGNEPDLETAMAATHPDDIGRTQAQLNSAIETGESYSSEARMKRADGSWRMVLNRAVCQRDNTGKVVTVLGTVLDVTEVKLADEALRLSEARYRFLAEQSQDIIVRADRQGTILYISPGCRKMGYEPEELIGTRAALLAHPEDLERLVANTAHVFAGGVLTARELEHRFRCKTGEWIWLQSNPRIITDERGVPCEVVDVFRDVSERRKTEIDLARAQKAAEDAAAVKGQFLANMSHELRTPLTSIIGFAQLLKEQPELSESSVRFADRVVQASHTLLGIVNDVLDFSKLEAGQVEIHREPCSLRTIATDALELFAPQTDAKGVARRLELDANLPHTLDLDADRMRQILLNLIGNAVKFTDRGAVTLKAGYRDGRLRLEVTDTGPGIPKNQLRKLFQRFSQVDGSTSRAHGGSGLGLAICKGLVEAMQGTIGVTSLLGDGSRFWFEIPAVIAAAPKRQAAVADSHPTLDGLRALIVDDNPANRILLAAMLEPYNVQVTLAECGQHAIDMAGERNFDVILMDLHMPGLDGYQAAQAIRRGGPNAAVPILAFTADVLSHDDSRLTGGVFQGAVAKPVSPAELSRAILAQCKGGAPLERQVRHG